MQHIDLTIAVRDLSRYTLDPAIDPSRGWLVLLVKFFGNISA